MRVLAPGHKYELSVTKASGWSTGTGTDEFQFLQEPTAANPDRSPIDGPTCQEVIRMLINRVGFLNVELPWEGNARIIEHLRAALLEFEIRAMQRKLEKGQIAPELIKIDDDGHFLLTESSTLV